MDQVEFAKRNLDAGRDALVGLLRMFEGDAARWRPEPGKWSAVEIANHLADEERDDFRSRFKRTLKDPQARWEPIDPEGWVVARAYAERDLSKSIDRFDKERETSLRWLAELDRPDLDLTHEHPHAGSIRAGDLLAAWIAHDLFHVRQLVRLRYRYLAEALPGYDPSYAGEWGES